MPAQPRKGVTIGGLVVVLGAVALLVGLSGSGWLPPSAAGLGEPLPGDGATRLGQADQPGQVAGTGTAPGSPEAGLPAGGPGPTAAPTAPPTPTAKTAGPAPKSGPTTTPKPTPKPTPRAVAPPPVSHCPIFPSNNVWNLRVDGLPVASISSTMIAAIGLGSHLHPDFSNGGGYGIPYNLVSSSTPRSKVSFQYTGESDKVGYPIPSNVKIEGGSDRHVLMVDTSACKLYELYAASRSGGAWNAGSGAVWSLRSNALRPSGWTSADAAGLPIFPGLVRYDEVAAGKILHAVRFTAPHTCAGFIYPARHEAGSGSCSALPPMGLRVRLKAGVDISGFGSQARILLTALKRYGMILADNGSPWYVSGAPSSHWNDDVLHALGNIKGSDFEVVDTAGFVNGG